MTYIQSENSREADEELSDEDLDEVNELENKRQATIRPISGLRRGSVFSKTFDPEDDNETSQNEQNSSHLQHRTSDDDDDYEIIQNRSFECHAKNKTKEQKNKLYQIISSIIIFRHLYDEDIYDIIDSMFERKCTQNEEIIREGDNGNYFYVIYSGSYEAYIKGKKTNDVNNNNELVNEKYGRKVRDYKDAGYFGELALLYDQPRLATIVVKEDGTLFCMNRDKFKRLVIGSEFKRRKMYEVFLESVPLLKSMNNYERSQVADALRTKTFQKGQVVFKQNDPNANGMYFVESGKVRIVREEDDEEVELKILGVGEYFGELALVNKAPRSASAYVYDDGNDDPSPCKLAFLDIDAFERLMGPCIELIKSNMSIYKDLESTI